MTFRGVAFVVKKSNNYQSKFNIKILTLNQKSYFLGFNLKSMRKNMREPLYLGIYKTLFNNENNNFQ